MSVWLKLDWFDCCWGDGVELMSSPLFSLLLESWWWSGGWEWGDGSIGVTGLLVLEVGVAGCFFTWIGEDGIWEEVVGVGVCRGFGVTGADVGGGGGGESFSFLEE